MAIGDMMQKRRARREARRAEQIAERDARRAERMAERLSRMADRPMRTPDPAPTVSRGPALVEPTVAVSSRRKAENARRAAMGMPLLPDPTLRPPARPVAPEVSGTTFGDRAYSPDLETRFRPRFVDENAGGMGIAGLTIDPRRFRPPVPQYAMPQPGQSYGSWLSSQIRGGVDFGNVDPRAVYNQGSDRPLPNVEALPPVPPMQQMPTQPGGKGGQIATQPGGKGAGTSSLGASLPYIIR